MINKQLFLDHIVLLPEIHPHDDEFELWASVFLHHELISNLEFEQGADRHLMRFTFKHMRFNLNFEHYSQSIWINCDSEQDAQMLPDLFSSL